MSSGAGCLVRLAVLALWSGLMVRAATSAPTSGAALARVALVWSGPALLGVLARRTRRRPGRMTSQMAPCRTPGRGVGAAPAWAALARDPAPPPAPRPGDPSRRRSARASRGSAAAESGPARARDPVSAQLRFRVLERDGFRCRYCGRAGSTPGVVLHVDHVVPRVAGGATAEGNLRTACEECNLGKAARVVRLDGPAPHV